jgi:hypothetical protein
MKMPTAEETPRHRHGKIYTVYHEAVASQNSTKLLSYSYISMKSSRVKGQHGAVLDGVWGILGSVVGPGTKMSQRKSMQCSRFIRMPCEQAEKVGVANTSCNNPLGITIHSNIITTSLFSFL